jgi:hypothetical protein
MSWAEFYMGGWVEMALELNGISSCAAFARGQRRDQRIWRISIVKIRYQEKTSEKDWEDLARALVICKVCRSAIALQVLVVPSRVCVCVYVFNKTIHQYKPRL